MANEYRYKFQKGSKKSLCPECNNKTFVQYIDTTTGELMPKQYGRCDRESKCSYYFPPPEPQEIKCLYVPFSKLIDYSKKAFQITTENGIYYLPKSMVFETIDNGFYVSEWYLSNTNKPPQFLNNDFRFYLSGELIEPSNNLKEEKPAPKVEPVFIPVEVFNHTRQGYEQNVFIQNLLNRVPFPFEVGAIEKVISQYNLGTVSNGYRAGAITFPYIDAAGNIRAIQVKQFDQANHTTGTDFLHSIIEKHHTKRNEPLPGWLNDYKNNEKIVSCLFGEHLLNKYPLNPVGLVEAPKTAVYCSLYFGFPEQPLNLLWLAVYNLSSLNIEKCKVLQGRDVVLFPDLSKDGKAFQDWSNKAKQFQKLMPGTRFEVSDLLETLAPNELKEHGADIADVLIKQDWRNFKPKQPISEPQAEPAPTPKSEKGENSDALKQPLFFHAEPTVIIDNIISLPTETNTGQDFENMKIVWVKTIDGSYDVLFDAEGEPVQHITDTVSRLATYFEKDFKPALIDGKRCLAQMMTDFPEQLASVKNERPDPPKELQKLAKPHKSWEQDITELENYFTGITLPTQPVKLNQCSTITNCSLFIESHFATVKANNGKRTFLPYLNRLQELKQVLTTNIN